VKIPPKAIHVPIAARAQAARPPEAAKKPEATAMEPPLDPPPLTLHQGDFLGGGLSPALLSTQMVSAQKALAALKARPLPENAADLGAAYAAMGQMIAKTEAVLLSALDALDPQTGGGVARPSESFAQMRQDAFDLLDQAGQEFARLEKAFAPIVHGPGGWANRPIEVSPDRGDGESLRHYANSFKNDQATTPDVREAEYQKRVDKFLNAGGRFEDFLLGGENTLSSLEHRARYDYVMLPDGLTRLYPTGKGRPKPGHSLLADGDMEFSDDAVLLAGELWVLRDSAGDVEAVVVANNSGHFKPRYEDLQNAIPVIKEWGVKEEQIILFGGPNNLPSLLVEIERRCGVPGLSDQIPPEPHTLLERWSDSQSPLATRLGAQLPDD
jgi:hypothetical protein